MNYNCMNILKWTESQLKYTYDVSLQEATPQELHEALGQAVMMSIADNWSNSKRTRMHQRKAYYISAEYLVGRLVYSNLYNLGILDEMKQLDMQIASEFITMASHLMLIKTKMLLSAAEQAEAESELDQLRQSLLERRRREAMEQIRQAIVQLEPRNEIGRCIFTKEPEPLPKEKTYRYQHSTADLLRALDLIAERNQRQLPPPTANFKGIVAKEPYPVNRKAGEVLRQLVLRGVERLKSLFRGNKSRSEIVATFLAILELCKTNSVVLEDDNSGENPNVRLIKTDAQEES